MWDNKAEDSDSGRPHPLDVLILSTSSSSRRAHQNIIFTSQRIGSHPHLQLPCGLPSSCTSLLVFSPTLSPTTLTLSSYEPQCCALQLLVYTGEALFHHSDIPVVISEMASNTEVIGSAHSLSRIVWQCPPCRQPVHT